MAVVAQHNDGADRWLRSVVSGRPLDGSVMQTAANIGAITLKDGSAKANVQLLPFDGHGPSHREHGGAPRSTWRLRVSQCVKPSLLHSDDITTFWTSPYQPHKVRLQRRRPVSPHTRVVVNTSPPLPLVRPGFSSLGDNSSVRDKRSSH